MSYKNTCVNLDTSSRENGSYFLKVEALRSESKKSYVKYYVTGSAGMSRSTGTVYTQSTRDRMVVSNS